VAVATPSPQHRADHSRLRGYARQPSHEAAPPSHASRAGRTLLPAASTARRSTDGPPAAELRHARRLQPTRAPSLTANRTEATKENQSWWPSLVWLTTTHHQRRISEVSGAVWCMRCYAASLTLTSLGSSILINVSPQPEAGRGRPGDRAGRRRRRRGSSECCGCPRAGWRRGGPDRRACRTRSCPRSRPFRGRVQG
jgi:hypothetical protein